MFKILDKYLIKTFLPTMIMATLIAVFVLTMQQLWLYLDEIMGKGVSFWDITEMLVYMSVSFLPLGMPIGILIASVMLLGSLGEHYELAGIKSAGVSLSRTMLPLLFACIGLAIFSFYTANNLIPYTNLKSKTLLYDIRKQKPTLNLKEGVYNYDFKGYAIKIGEKSDNGQDLKDVFIYDHSNMRRNEVIIITARKGKMYTTADEKYLVMELEDGHQYQELKDNSSDRSFPVMRSDFEKFEKIFDLSEFGLTRTSSDVFKQHESMLNVGQLSYMVDSLRSEMADAKTEHIAGLILKPDSTDQTLDKRFSDDDIRYQNRDSLQISDFAENTPFYLRFKDNFKDNIISRATGKLRYYDTRANSLNRKIQTNTEKISRYTYQKHTKFSLAVVCVIFLFIGAPMGAIVRKGGVGYPMLIAIIFFMLFIVITMYSKSMVDKAMMNPYLGSWLSCIILFPLGVFLTIKARNDSKFIQIDAIIAFFERLFTRKKDKEENLTES